MVGIGGDFAIVFGGISIWGPWLQQKPGIIHPFVLDHVGPRFLRNVVEVARNFENMLGVPKEVRQRSGRNSSRGVLVDQWDWWDWWDQIS